jgi:hypothetical protein
VADDDVMDVEAVREQLARAIAQQAGSLVTLALMAGALRGTAAAGLKDRLQTFAEAEVADTQRLVEKLTALSGRLQPCEVPAPPGPDLVPALQAFLEREEQVLTTLHAVIGPSGQEPPSEALEHLIEHVLLRKQQQIDFLRLALDA